VFERDSLQDIVGFIPYVEERRVRRENPQRGIKKSNGYVLQVLQVYESSDESLAGEKTTTTTR
jgi:hypothetical protein